MQFDLSTSHRRFAAYELGDAPNTAARIDDMSRYYERAFGLQEQELGQRMKIASMQAGNTRASINNAAKAEKARLALATRQLEEVGIPQVAIQRFVAESNAAIARQGLQLDYLNAYAQARNSPDMQWYAKDWANQFRALNNGVFTEPNMQRMATTQSQGGAPQPQSLQSLVQELTGGAGSGAAVGGAAGGGTGASADGQSGDPRVQAITSLLNASPPSAMDGLNDEDANNLRVIQGLFQKGLDINAVQRMSPGKQKYLLSGGQRLGYDPNEELYKASRSRYTMGDAAAA